MIQHTFFPDETFEQAQERMLRETARFIEWGLTHPKLIPWIPHHLAGQRDFSGRIKRAFWGFVWTYRGMPN